MIAVLVTLTNEDTYAIVVNTRDEADRLRDGLGARDVVYRVRSFKVITAAELDAEIAIAKQEADDDRG